MPSFTRLDHRKITATTAFGMKEAKRGETERGGLAGKSQGLIIA
jgi:hypothetical protein